MSNSDEPKSNSDNEPHNDDEDAIDDEIWEFAKQQLIKAGEEDSDELTPWIDELARDIDAAIEGTLSAIENEDPDEAKWRFTPAGTLIMPDEEG